MRCPLRNQEVQEATQKGAQRSAGIATTFHARATWLPPHERYPIMRQTLCRICNSLFCEHAENSTICDPIISYSDVNDMYDGFDDGNPLRVGLHDEYPHTVNGKSMSAKDALAANASLTTNPALTAALSQSNDKSNIIDISTQWVSCNFCKKRVFTKYLDDHIKVHVHQVVDETVPATSTALVR